MPPSALKSNKATLKKKKSYSFLLLQSSVSTFLFGTVNRGQIFGICMLKLARNVRLVLTETGAAESALSRVVRILAWADGTWSVCYLYQVPGMCVAGMGWWRGWGEAFVIFPGRHKESENQLLATLPPTPPHEWQSLEGRVCVWFTLVHPMTQGLAYTRHSVLQDFFAGVLHSLPFIPTHPLN